MKKRSLALLMVLVMIVGLLAACGDKSGSGDAQSDKKDEKQEEKKDEAKEEKKDEAKEEKSGASVFTYAIAGDTGNTLNPLTADDRWGLMTTHMLYSPMYFINPDGSVDYILAESMVPSEDGLSYTMTLKDGLKWSDDQPLTADDIVFTFDSINAQTQNLYVDGKPIALEKKDDKTVVFKLPSVSASVFEMLSAEISILPKHIFENRNSFDVNMLEEKVVGAGPYTLEEYSTGQYLKFKKNPNYANGEAKIETVIFKVIEKNDTASLALQNGDIDAWIGLPDLLEPFENNENFNIMNYTEGRVAYLRLNPTSENMKDKNFREGILYAIDRAEIMMAGYTDDKYYELGYSFLPFNNAYYSEDVQKWTQDVEKAKEKLANGPKKLKLLYVGEDPVQTNQALTLQTQLKAVGIELELVGVQWAAYMKPAYDNTDGTYDMFLGGYVMGVDPDAFSSLFVSTKDNMINFNSPEIDALFHKANSVLDPAERKTLYNELQKKVSEEAIFYPFGSNLRTLVVSSKVKNIEEAKLVPIYTFGDMSKLTIE